MSIPGSLTPLFNSGAGVVGITTTIERSLRFNSADSAYLSRTPGTAGNRQKWTWAGWVKRSAVSSGNQRFFGIFQGGVVQEYFRFSSGDTLVIAVIQETKGFTTTQVFRDPSAWYHIVVVLDTPQATASDRLKLYVNGTQVTTFSSTDYPVQNSTGDINNTYPHFISNGGNGEYFNGYMADIHFIDGQALTPSSFTEVSATTGQLIPLAYSGTFGTNGFKLKFSDNSAATATTLGKDYSGNSNNWTPTNLVVAGGGPIYSDMTTCGGGFMTTNPKTNLFDNSLVTEAVTQTVEGSGSGTGVFTPSPPISYNSSVQVYGGESGQDEARINGGSYIGLNGGYLTLATGSGTITTIEWHDRRGDGTRGSLSAILVDGVMLVDAAPASGIDSLVDTPTSYGTPDTGVGGEVRGNYCTLNPLAGTQTLSNGNLDWDNNSADSHRPATIAMTTGKWYCEFLVSSNMGVPGFVPLGFTGSYPGQTSTSWGWYGGYGIYNNASGIIASTFSANDLIQIAFDADSGKLWFGKNNTWLVSGNPSTGVNPTVTPGAGTWFFAAGGSAGGAVTLNSNFGQRAFAYTAPSGFKALCDTNIAEGTITTSGTFTGNANADGPFVYLNGVPTAMTINSNSVTFGTHADKLSNGFKVRNSTSTYNVAGSNTFSVSTTDAKFKFSRAQPNP